MADLSNSWMNLKITICTNAIAKRDHADYTLLKYEILRAHSGKNDGATAYRQ